MPRFYNAVLARDTTDCTGPNTGSVQTSGGLYVAKQARISGVVNILDTTPSTSYTNGAFIVGGGGGFGGDIFSAASIQGTRFVASALNALTTPAEAWIGPSITTGLYFKSGNVGIGPNANNPGYALDVRGSGATSGIRTDMGLDLNPVPSPTTGGLALVLAAGNVDVGLHYYVVTFITAQGETNGYVIGSVTTDGTHGQVDVTIPTSSDPRVTGRKLYRTKVGGNYWQTYSLATIGNNTQTTYTDNVADASLGATVGAGYWQINSTSKMITVGGVKGMALDIMGTALGLLAGSSLTTGGGNAFYAYRAGRYTTTGNNNSFFGDSAGVDNTTGSDNCYFGWGAGGPTTGSYNLGGGRNALNSLNDGSSYNVGLGWYALGGNGTPTAASNTTAVGARAGYLAQGSNGIYLGSDAGHYETLSNTLLIDAIDRTNQTLSRSRALVYGVMSTIAANQTLALGGGGLTTINGGLVLTAGTNTRPSLNVPDGSAPDIGARGDVWAVGGGLYYYNGTRTLNLTDVVATATASGTTNLDGNQKTTIQVNVTGDTTLNMTNGGADGQRLTLELKQDASGNHAITIGTGFAWGADITAYTPTLTALKTDYLGLVYNATAAAWRIIAIAKGY